MNQTEGTFGTLNEIEQRNQSVLAGLETYFIEQTILVNMSGCNIGT